MKKVLCLMMVFTMVLLVGCNNAPNTATTTAERSTTAAQTTQSPTTKQTTPPDPTTEKVVIDKDFYQEGSYILEDSNGYKFKISVKISPWIRWSESDVLNRVWSDLGKKNSMPTTISDWGFKEKNGIYLKDMRYGDAKSWFRCNSSNFEMYYAVGLIGIDNVTQGFDITNSNSKDFTWQIFLDQENKDYKWTDDSRPYLYRFFYSSPRDAGYSKYLGAFFSAHMESNKWGPVTFIIAHGDGSTPNNPNGIYRELLESYVFRIEGKIEFNMKMYNP